MKPANSKLTIVQTIALLCIGIGLFYLIKFANSYFYYFRSLFDERFTPMVRYPLGTVLLLITEHVIVILRPIAGFGLVRLKTWGRNLTIGVLTADFIMRAISFYNFHTFALRHPEMADKVAEMLTQGSEVVEFHSIIPSYIIAAISLASVIVLMKIDWKEIQK